MKALTTVIFVLLTVFALTTIGYSEIIAENTTSAEYPEEANEIKVASSEEANKITETTDESSTDTPCIPDNVSVNDSRYGVKTVSIKKGARILFDSNPWFEITVANNGQLFRRDIKYVIHALTKDNTIIATVKGDFAGGEYIRPGEKARVKAIFFNLNSHDDYDRLRYVLK